VDAGIVKDSRCLRWSLLGNFEWAEGYGWRFGLYRMGLSTLSRTSAKGSEEFRRLAPGR